MVVPGNSSDYCNVQMEEQIMSANTRLAAMVAAAVFLATCSAASAQAKLDASILTKYLDPLPIPSVVSPVGLMDGDPYYEVTVSQFTQQLHSELPPTTVWGYNGSYPGPSFNVQANVPVKIKWMNDLTTGSGEFVDHLLPVDTSLMVPQPAGPDYTVGGVPLVTHLHGGHIEADSDGHPNAWFTPGFGSTGSAFAKEVYEYSNSQEATSLWYHDHTIGMTRLNVYAGLAGFYMIRDAQEASLNLPAGDYEIPLVIQDRAFYEDGSLYYPKGPGSATDPLNGLPESFPSDASVVEHFMGDAHLVNGKVWPHLEVEPRKYRFRVLNGANGRTYKLQLAPDSGGPVTLNQIGSDGGLLGQTVPLDAVELASAERADLVVDFSSFSPGDTLTLRDTKTQGGAGPEIMQFRVVPLNGPDTSDLPANPGTVVPIDRSEADVTRDMVLTKSSDEYGRLKLLLNGMGFHEPATAVVQLDDTEIWRIFNPLDDAHPIHLHLVQFQVLGSQALAPDGMGGFLSELDAGAPYLLPDDNLTGWKDTVNVPAGSMMEFIMRFEDYTGDFVWHCHILEHEDWDMMRPYRVVPEPATLLILAGGSLLALRRRRT